MPKIRVVLADDHAILREGMRALLGYYDDIQVVGEAQDGSEAVARVGELEPDIVVMDIAMPGMNGIEATRAIRAKYPATQVLVLTQHESREYVLTLLEAGASGYILKRAIAADLIAALRTVAAGQVFLHPPVATTLVRGMLGQVESLTPRESEVLHLIVSGQTNTQIAKTLCLSVKTVEWHRTNMMSKLSVHSVGELMRYAYDHGLVEPEA
jgi:DNA-binding NarL/FixJ family response regulator